MGYRGGGDVTLGRPMGGEKGMLGGDQNHMAVSESARLSREEPRTDRRTDGGTDGRSSAHAQKSSVRTRINGDVGHVI